MPALLENVSIESMLLVPTCSPTERDRQGVS
jgi:hypothetical protein